MGTQSSLYLPDGQPAWLPVDPRTWADAGTGARGDALRAPLIEMDAGSAVAWHRQRPLFQGIAATAQSIPAATWTAITDLSELIDNYAGHSDSASANTGRYYVPATASNTTGGDWYLCSGYMPFGSTGATGNNFIAGLRDTGGTVMEGGKLPGGAAHNTDSLTIDLLQMNGANSDYVELMAYQNTAAAVNTVVSNKTPSLTVRWVCADQAWAGIATPPAPATPHVWTDADILTGSATGAGRVPLNVELRDLIRFLNNPPIARLTSQGTAQTIPNAGAWTSIQFPTKTVDNYGGWASGNPSRYTCQRAGLYLVAGTASVADVSASGGYRASRLLVNGATAWLGGSMLPQTTGTAGTSPIAATLLRLNIGDYVELQVAQTSTAALSVNAGANNAAKLVVVWMAK